MVGSALHRDSKERYKPIVWLGFSTKVSSISLSGELLRERRIILGLGLTLESTSTSAFYTVDFRIRIFAFYPWSQAATSVTSTTI